MATDGYWEKYRVADELTQIHMLESLSLLQYKEGLFIKTDITAIKSYLDDAIEAAYHEGYADGAIEAD